jgi:hypothetical protein
MRHDSRVNTRAQKSVARKKYAERQFDKWYKWSFNNRGKILLKELIDKQKEYFNYGKI